MATLVLKVDLDKVTDESDAGREGEVGAIMVRAYATVEHMEVGDVAEVLDSTGARVGSLRLSRL